LVSGQATLPLETSQDNYAAASVAIDAFLERFQNANLSAPVIISEQAGGSTGDDGLRAALSRVSERSAFLATEEDRLKARIEAEQDVEKKNRWTSFLQIRRGERLDAEAFKAGVLEETIADWAVKNSQTSRWGQNFSLAQPTVVLTETESAELKGSSKRGEIWESLRAKYPGAGGLVIASRAGFNRDRTQAIVEIGFPTGPVGGEGAWVLLTKANGNWQVRGLLLSWIS
jgi:hypothetical protein